MNYKKQLCLMMTLVSVLTVQSMSVFASNYIDVHMHLNGIYLERHPGKLPVIKTDYSTAAANLVAMMDQLGVRRSIVMPPPQTKENLRVDSRDLLPAVQQYSDRLVWGGGGDVLNSIIVATPTQAVTPRIKADFENKARQLIKSGIKVFGEMGALHFSFSDKHVFFQVSPDHPLFLLLADIAAETGVPIDLHMEAVPVDQETPPALIARSSKNPAAIKANIPAFERLLAHNPKAKIIWCHIGWDNTGHMTIELLRRLLQTHPNLYLSLKIVPPAREPFRFAQHDIVDDTHKIRPEWMKLFQEFPEHFVIGSDEFVGIRNQVRHVGPPSFQPTWQPLIHQLPPDLAQKIGGANAASLYMIK